MISSVGTVTAAGGNDELTPIEDAIFAWVVAGSGLAASQVIWAESRGPIPTGTYISLRLLTTKQISSDWLVSREVAGQIVHHVRGTRHPTLEMTCFAGGHTGSTRAQQVLQRVLTSIKLPTVAAILRAGDVGIGTRGQVRTVQGVRSAMFDPRAIVEVGLHLVTDISEPGSSIDTVEVETPGPVTQTVA